MLFKILEVVSPVAYWIKVLLASRMHDVGSVEHLYSHDETVLCYPRLASAVNSSAVTRVLGELIWSGHWEVLCLHDSEEGPGAVWQDASVLGGDLDSPPPPRVPWALGCLAAPATLSVMLEVRSPPRG